MPNKKVTGLHNVISVIFPLELKMYLHIDGFKLKSFKPMEVPNQESDFVRIDFKLWVFMVKELNFVFEIHRKSLIYAVHKKSWKTKNPYFSENFAQQKRSWLA